MSFPPDVIEEARKRIAEERRKALVQSATDTLRKIEKLEGENEEMREKIKLNEASIALHRSAFDA